MFITFKILMSIKVFIVIQIKPFIYNKLQVPELIIFLRDNIKTRKVYSLTMIRQTVAKEGRKKIAKFRKSLKEMFHKKTKF